MQRVLVRVVALGFCACLAAGCGGLSAQQAARGDAKLLFDDPHAQVMHVDTFQNLSGTREAVVTMQGHFRGQAFVNPSCSSCPADRYIALDFLLPPHPGRFDGFAMLTPSMVAATARARSASPLFRIFPDIGAPAVRCSIPRGGSSPGTIDGVCLTNTYPEPSNHVRRVEFIEHWPFVTTSNGSWPKYEKTGRWIVTLNRGGSVQSIERTGQQPPQLWGHLKVP
jgi:hypothetical protein